jgi:hypothetical protein
VKALFYLFPDIEIDKRCAEADILSGMLRTYLVRDRAKDKVQQQIEMIENLSTWE